MAHLQSQIKGGYYPFPPMHLPALASYFKASEGGRVLDPCSGEGDALKHLADAWSLTPYANELDATRAAACREKFGDERAVQGDIMTLRTPNRAYSVVFINPPYAENSGHADEKRREFEMLAHAWKWVQDGGFCVWVVYAHHMTERAASFLVKHSSLVDIYRLPRLHLDTYPQIVVVARARPIERGEDISAEVLKLVDEPVYRIPPAAPIKRFYFHPDENTPDLMLPAIQSGGAQRCHTFQAVVDVTPQAPPLAPIVPPRGGQLGLILASGLFNGLLLDIEDSQAAVRGVVRMAEINTTPPGLVGIKETIEHRAQVTITLLHKNGKVTVIDVSKLFRQTARASADFTSGWATGQAGGASSTVVPLQNLIGKHFAHQGGAFEVVDYGPLDQAAYRVKGLAGGAVSLLAAQTVVQAAMLPAGALIPSTPKPAPRPVLPVSRRPTLDELARRHGLTLHARPLPTPSMPQQMPLFGLASAGGD